MWQRGASLKHRVTVRVHHSNRVTVGCITQAPCESDGTSLKDRVADGAGTSLKHRVSGEFLSLQAPCDGDGHVGAGITQNCEVGFDHQFILLHPP
jgi:hypothetical protein